MNTAEHVSALIGVIFEAAAAALRERGESANAFVIALSATEIVASVEVARDGGDWQRNLVAAITESQPGYEIDANITDDEQIAIAAIGHVEVSDADLADVSLALARAGVARLDRELSGPQPALT